MSTKRSSKKNRAILRLERFKIIEYVCIGLVILLFLALATFYGSGRSLRRTGSPEATVSPEPTEDVSIRGMHVFSALDDAGFDVRMDGEGYAITAENGITLSMRMQSDDRGIVTLSFETPLSADPDDDSAVSTALREKNEETVKTLRTLFDRVMPVFHRSIYDSETIVKQCVKVAQKNETYAKHFGEYSVRIMAEERDALPVVTVTLQRDS